MIFKLLQYYLQHYNMYIKNNKFYEIQLCTQKKDPRAREPNFYNDILMTGLAFFDNYNDGNIRCKIF
jgi:hypothetical protein